MARRLFIDFYRRKLRNSRYLIRVGLVAVYVILLTLILPRPRILDYNYEVGKAWQEDQVVAPFDFAVYKPVDSLEAERIRAARQILPIFRVDSSVLPEAEQRIEGRLEEFGQRLGDFLQARTDGDSSQMRKLRRSLFGNDYPDLEAADYQKPIDDRLPSLINRGINLSRQAYNRGFLIWNRSENVGPFISLRRMPTLEEQVSTQQILIGQESLSSWINQRTQNLPKGEQKLLNAVLVKSMAPNYVFAEDLTLETKNRQMARVSPVQGLIKEGNVIIERGDIVDVERKRILDSLLLEQSERTGDQNNWNSFLGRLIMVGVITLLLLVYLSVNRPRIYFNNLQLGLILFTFFIAVGSMVVATKFDAVAGKLSEIISPNLNLSSVIYLAPVSIVPIFITNFFGLRTGFLCNLMLAFYGAVLIQQDLEFAYVQIFAGTVAAYSLRRLKKREVFFYTLAYIFLAYCVAYISFNFFAKGSLALINYETLLLFAINVAITIIAYNLIYLFERLFGVTSDMTYLELLDTNHPLLQELARKAPGTFQHSLQVANIAEAAVTKVGGKALLTHVGALYHDIGKMNNPKFFIENLAEDKRENPHLNLEDLESAETIIAHVREGVELAHRYHLPKEMIDFIQTHHGTTRVEYFYRHYLSEHDKISGDTEDRFRYPGPKPFSKETAVLMIADSIEAASRTLKHITPETLRNLVDKIIDHKIEDNQLENSNLTFKDISAIRNCVYKQLLTIYHSRIEYPEEEEAEKEAVK